MSEVNISGMLALAQELYGWDDAQLLGIVADYLAARTDAACRVAIEDLVLDLAAHLAQRGAAASGHDPEAAQETLSIVADPAVMAAIADGERELREEGLL